MGCNLDTFNSVGKTAIPFSLKLLLYSISDSIACNHIKFQMQQSYFKVCITLIVSNAEW